MAYQKNQSSKLANKTNFCQMSCNESQKCFNFFILFLTLQEVIHTVKGLPVFKPSSQSNSILKSEK